MFRLPSRRRTSAFTLIELAVVVLIIALIAGVALPTFFRHRERATDRTMISDLVSAKKLALTYYMDRLGGKGSFTGFDPDSEPEWSSNITWGAPLANGQIGVISTSRNDRTWTLIQVAQPVDTDAGTIPVGTWVGNNTPDTWPDLDTVATHIDADGDGVADLDPDITTNLLTPPGVTSAAGSGGDDEGLSGEDGGLVLTADGSRGPLAFTASATFENACVSQGDRVLVELVATNTGELPVLITGYHDFGPTIDEEFDVISVPDHVLYVTPDGLAHPDFPEFITAEGLWYATPDFSGDDHIGLEEFIGAIELEVLPGEFMEVYGILLEPGASLYHKFEGAPADSPAVELLVLGDPTTSPALFTVHGNVLTFTVSAEEACGGNSEDLNGSADGLYGPFEGSTFFTAFHAAVASSGAAAHYPFNCPTATCSSPELADDLWVDNVFFQNPTGEGPVLFATDFSSRVSDMSGAFGDQGVRIQAAAGTQLSGPIELWEWDEELETSIESFIGGDPAVAGWDAASARSIETVFRILEEPPHDAVGYGFGISHGLGVGLAYEEPGYYTIHVGPFGIDDPDGWGWGPPIRASFQGVEITPNADYHLVVVVTETTIDVWLNGTQIGSTDIASLHEAASYANIPTASGLHVGVAVGEVFFDELALYNHALSPTEITTHYESLTN